jgi:mannose-6-phosphate isomerase-like protein (cupin superfamily)
MGREKCELVPGTAVWGPPGVSHQLFNDSDETCKILWVLSPPGREKDIIDHAR